MGALARLLALLLVRKGREAEHDLVGRGVEGALPVLEVKEDPNARLYELLEGIGHFDGFAAQSALFAHNQDLEGRRRRQGIHQPEKARALRKLRTADPVVELAPLCQ